MFDTKRRLEWGVEAGLEEWIVACGRRRERRVVFCVTANSIGSLSQSEVVVRIVGQ
jgi:hypothetical protein